MRALAILTVRNEGAFLLEWFAHHRAVGFTDFLVFSNDCADGTDAILNRMAELDWLVHEDNPGPYEKAGVQFTALKRAAKHPSMRDADWIMALDVDEFVNIHTGDGSLAALLAALDEATAITLTWRLFGNADQVHYQDQPVTDTFTRAAPEIMHWPWRSAMFKTLYRNDGTYGKPGVHRPRDAKKERLGGAKWYDGEGRLLDEQFKTRRIFSNYGQKLYGLAQLNHYPLGAMESFVLKADRGRAVHSDQLLGLDYWTERNFNHVEDKSIARYGPARDAILAELKGDAILGNLHEKAVAWRRARFDTIMLQEPYRALMGRLMMAAPSRAINPSWSRLLVSYANKSRNASEMP